MKKTITQRFFLSLCLMIVGCLGGAGNSAWAEELAIDFESAVSTYTDWTFSNMTSKQTGNITAHGGTYYGTTGGKETASITTKKAIPYPSTITFYVSKQSTSSATSSWKIQVSSDKSSWTDVKAQSATSMSKGTWVEVKQDLSAYSNVYVRVYYKGSAAVRNIDDLSLTYTTTAPTTLKVSESAIAFGNVETGQKPTKTITISGTSLSEDVSLSLSGDESFSVDKDNILKGSEGNIEDAKVTVTYAPTTTGEHSATLKITSGDISKTVSLTGTGVTPKTHYTVTWMVNGTSYTEGTPSTDVAEGEKVATLPANPEAIGSKVFIGWTASAFSGTSASAPADLFTTAEDAPSVTGNTTYYAVFAKVLSSTSSWNRVKTLAEITEGSYVIKNDTYILPSTTTTSNPSAVTAPTITGDEITGAVEESMIWQFSSTGTANQFYVRNADGSYLYAINENAGLRVSSTSDKWTFTTNTTGYFSMKESNNSRYCGAYTDKQDWRSYSSATASNYANGGKLELYKLFSENTYTAYATTVATLADRNLSFGETTAFDVYDNTFVAPTLTGQTSGVTYASSNTSVATVNETGAVTLEGGFGTTTITASAAEDEVNGYLAGEASYTLSVWPNSIAGIKTMITSTTAVDFKAQLTNATITYVNDRNVYLQDADAAILMYLADGHGLTAGKSYTGKVSGKATLFSGLREITSIDLSGITPTDNTIEPKEVTLAALNADYDKYESMYVKVAGVKTGTFTTSDPVQTTTLTQDEATLAFAAPSTITLVENNDYDFVGFLGMYNSTPQFKIYEESQATNQGKFAAGLAFEQATYYAEVNEIITVTATNASGAKITYSVDNGTHAIVDENTGVFYADAVGTYTITATCPETGTHYAGMTTCQVIVTQPAANIHATTYYKKITSSDELVDGGVYLIVCESMNEAMGTIDYDNISKRRCLGANITLSNNTYTGSVNQSGHPYEVTITKGNNGYYNLYHAGGKYINILSNTSDADFTFAATGDNGWSISFDNSGNALISNKNHQNKAENYIQRHSSNNYYKNYQNGQAPIQLYQKVGEMPIAKATGYVSTYVADFAYVMPKHITGHTVTSAAQQGVISTTKVFRAGDEVPALTPLLIKSDEDYDAEENSRNYSPAVLNKTVEAYTGENMLEYRRTAANLTNTMKNGSVYYYKLAIKNEKVGFYWGAADGAAFIMTKPSTAYLTVPQSISVQGFVLNLEEGETTGIATVVTNEDAPIYNLQGIRMNGKNLPKGIYIQGGKKFMVK